MPGQTEDVGDDGCPGREDVKPQKDESNAKNDKPLSTGDIFDLSSCNLYSLSLPHKDYLSTTELNLDYNNLTSLPNDIAAYLPNLKKLSLIGNDLNKFPETIGKLSKLQSISASENNLRYLPDSFKDLKELESLDLVGNKLTGLIPEFGSLEHLQRFDIEENALNFLPASFGCLQSLEVFEASRNELKILPDSFGQLKKLRILNLSHNGLETLPESFGNLPSLRWLDLSENLIEKLPDHLDSAPLLERLYIIGNLVKSVPEWIGIMPNLKELSFRDNQLVDKPFSEAFGSVSVNLQNLDFSGNFIKSLPSTLGNLKQLKTLYFGSVIGELERRNFQNGNWIPQLPDSFGNLQNLTELRSDENQIAKLPENFGLLTNLEFLDIGQNMLQNLPTSFCQLVSLKVCKLSKNHLVSIPADFGNLKNLADLRLDSNQLTELPKSVENLTELTTLDLFANNLKAIPEQLSQLKKLSRLDLGENDFDLPYTQIPNLTQDNKYPVRDPNKADNWRGHVRADNVKRDTLPMFANNTETESPAMISQTLLLAMQNSRSIWESHEDSATVRQRPTVADTTQKNCLSMADKHASRGGNRLAELTESLECAGIYSDQEETYDGGNTGIRTNNGSYTFNYDSSEGNESECDLERSDTSIGEKPRDALSIKDKNVSPLLVASEVDSEDWDAELEASPPYDIKQIYQHPADKSKFVFNPAPVFEYIPSMDHMPPISTQSAVFEVDAGQFEDA